MRTYSVDIDEVTGVMAMALVESPAVDVDFIAMSKEKAMSLAFNEEKRVVTGVALRADFPIYRNNEEYGEHYIVFHRDVIERCMWKFMQEGRIWDVNIEHDPEHFVEGVKLVESYIVDRERGVTDKRFDVADGSWVVSYKVTNDEVWKSIKEKGVLKGFSIEGMFYQHPEDVDTMVADLI